MDPTTPKKAVPTASRKRAAQSTWPETERRRNSEEIQEMFDHCDIGYHAMDAQGIITLMNAVERRWLGYSSKEVVGCMKFQELLAVESRAEFETALEQLRERGWVRHLASRMRCRDGTTFPVMIHIAAIRDNEGRYLRCNVAVMNTAKQNQQEQTVRDLGEEFAMQVARQSRHDANEPVLPQVERRRQPLLDGGPPANGPPFGAERRRSILAAMSEGIAVFQCDGAIVTCNPTAQRILGFSDAMLASGHCPAPEWFSVQSDGSLIPAKNHPIRETARTGHACRDVILSVRRPDGSQRRVSLTTEPLFQAGEAAPQGVAMLLIDITARSIGQAPASP